MFSPYMTLFIVLIPLVAVMITYSAKDKLVEALDDLIRSKPTGGLIGLQEVEDALLVSQDQAFHLMTDAEADGLVEKIILCECGNCHHRSELNTDQEILDCPICKYKTKASVKNEFILFHKV